MSWNISVFDTATGLLSDARVGMQWPAQDAVGYLPARQLGELGELHEARREAGRAELTRERLSAVAASGHSL